MTMTQKELFAEVSALGLSIRVENGEYRIAPKLGPLAGGRGFQETQRRLNEQKAYYTDDREDALNTARHMAGKPQGRSTNVEFLSALMEAGSPLRQAFVMEAIGRYAKDIATEFDADEAAKNPAWGFISPHAWKDVATEIHAAMTERNRV